MNAIVEASGRDVERICVYAEADGTLLSWICRITTKRWVPCPPFFLWEKTMPNQNEKYTLYFQALIDELREQHNFTEARRPGQGKSYYAFASGTTAIKYVVGFYGKGRQAFTVLGIYSNDRKKKQSRF